MDTIVYRPARDELAYTFGGRMPVAHVRSGDLLEVFTEDCFGGLVRGPADLPSQVCRMPYLNPVSGPFFVEDAEPGDTLAVHLVSITPARDWGVSSTFPHFGALTSTSQTATLQPPLQERVWVYGIDRQAGTVRFQATETEHSVDLPLDPMIGTIGVAPGGMEARSTIVPDSHGGNLDTPELRAGTTLYLGVNVHGAMLALGDGHARQGEGEACGVGVEIATTTTLIVEVIKGMPTVWPRLETDTSLMSIGCARPLEDTYRIAQRDLVRWTSALTGLDELDAYQLVSQAGRAPIGNVCDPNYTSSPPSTRRCSPTRPPRTAGCTTGCGSARPGHGRRRCDDRVDPPPATARRAVPARPQRRHRPTPYSPPSPRTRHGRRGPDRPVPGRANHPRRGHPPGRRQTRAPAHRPAHRRPHHRHRHLLDPLHPPRPTPARVAARVRRRPVRTHPRRPARRRNPPTHDPSPTRWPGPYRGLPRHRHQVGGRGPGTAALPRCRPGTAEQPHRRPRRPRRRPRPRHPPVPRRRHTAAVTAQLRAIADQHHRRVCDITAAVDAAVGDLATATYR